MAELAEHAPQKTDLKTTALHTLRSVFWLPIFPQRAGRSDSRCVKRSGCLSGDGHRKWANPYVIKFQHFVFRVSH